MMRALVTGGASGIGLAIARAMTERGAQLILFDRIQPCVSWRSILVVKGSISAWWLT